MGIGVFVVVVALLLPTYKSLGKANEEAHRASLVPMLDVFCYVGVDRASVVELVESVLLGLEEVQSMFYENTELRDLELHLGG
jgi:hypothetical protein